MLLLLRRHVGVLHTSHVGLVLGEVHLGVMLGVWAAVVRDVVSETSLRRENGARLVSILLHLLSSGRGAVVRLLELGVVGHGCLRAASNVGLFAGGNRTVRGASCRRGRADT